MGDDKEVSIEGQWSVVSHAKKGSKSDRGEQYTIHFESLETMILTVCASSIFLKRLLPGC